MGIESKSRESLVSCILYKYIEGPSLPSIQVINLQIQISRNCVRLPWVDINAQDLFLKSATVKSMLKSASLTSQVGFWSAISIAHAAVPAIR